MKWVFMVFARGMGLLSAWSTVGVIRGVGESSGWSAVLFALAALVCLASTVFWLLVEYEEKS